MYVTSNRLGYQKSINNLKKKLNLYNGFEVTTQPLMDYNNITQIPLREYI
ncbi:hypothetical protein Syun_010560 [Stephania yunnanensis]|uniref:Uncharacterized protein n=1 Tax=Stephania yunnanensis TaxID=152371 RepID=A0AAP0KGQ7_9MAGN